MWNGSLIDACVDQQPARDMVSYRDLWGGGGGLTQLQKKIIAEMFWNVYKLTVDQGVYYVEISTTAS